MTKFNAKKTTCAAGHNHDSKIEARRCDDLTKAEFYGTISHLTQQPEFKVEINGRKVCVYKADFQYRMVDSGLPIVEDVKGMATPIFNLKKRLVEASYPGVVITVWPPKKRKAAKRKKAA